LREGLVTTGRHITRIGIDRSVEQLACEQCIRLSDTAVQLLPLQIGVVSIQICRRSLPGPAELETTLSAPQIGI
jgi:hypothetical protein